MTLPPALIFPIYFFYSALYFLVYDTYFDICFIASQSGIGAEYEYRKSIDRYLAIHAYNWDFICLFWSLVDWCCR